MAKDNRLRDAQLIEGLLEQVRLGIRSPDDVPWPRAMPKTGTIEHHDPVVLGCEIDQSTRDEILDHAAIAVKQDQRLASAAFQIVQANPSTSMNRPCGGLSRCALFASRRFMIAVAATRVPAAANAAAPGCRVMALKQSDRRELERVRRARRMCITLGGLHDAPSNEKCCS